jgi:hypothetical protein
VQRSDASSFVLYVEGARDREILECWGRRIDPVLARCIERNTVILGGRRPARALADFRKRGGAAVGLSGLIVLDRDDHPPVLDDPAYATTEPAQEEAAQLDASRSVADAEQGLEVFVWGLRHIESYLLVPAAIRRMLRLEIDDTTVQRFIAESVRTRASLAGRATEDPAADVSSDSIVSGQQRVHAKRILGAGGSLSEALGVELHSGDIARAMRLEDLHTDVHALFDRIGSLSGLAGRGPEVVIRPTR